LRKFFQKKSINQANILNVLLGGILTALILAFIIFTLHENYLQEIEKIEKQYINAQKEHIKKETNRALNYIVYKHKKDGGKRPLAELQSEIVDAIEQMRNKGDGTGYVFIYTFEGVNIADPILTQNAGKNLINIKDPNGKMVIAELIDVSQQEGGGYVEYMWNKPVSNIKAPKISYASSYAPWRWMVGSGVYLDNVRAEIEKKKIAYKKMMTKFVVGILSLSSLLFVIAMTIYRHFASSITKDLGYIQENLKSVSHNHKQLDLDSVQYDEFKQVSVYVNKMVEEIKKNKLALEDLNKNLENKVVRKTLKLQKAKEFAESLVAVQDKFIKNAIHEINTPLSIILTNIDLFNMHNPKNRYLTQIEAGVKIIHNNYNDLSYVAKKDRIVHTKTKLDFTKLLHERVEFFNEVALGNHVSLVTDIEPNVSIDFNETELQRVCDNNISNAIKYSYEDEDIMISLHKLGNKIMLEIVSIGDEIQNYNKLFDRFYREHLSRGGFGIGLHIVKEICEKYDVDIKVSSIDNHNSFKYCFKDMHEDTIT